MKTQDVLFGDLQGQICFYNIRFGKCGEVEDVVGVLTPVCRGVAQVFHDLLVELRLLLVAEVEEGEKEDRQEESWEAVQGGSQGKETTTTWMAMVME